MFGTLLRRVEVNGDWIEAGQLVGIISVEEKVIRILSSMPHKYRLLQIAFVAKLFGSCSYNRRFHSCGAFEVHRIASHSQDLDFR